MTKLSTIMDTNSYRASDASGLDESTKELVSRREELLASTYRLFYRHPVHLVRGKGQYVWDSQDNKYLDAYNNVVSIGHCHPAVIEAVTKQMHELNTHTRYLHSAILDYAEKLLATAPSAINRALFLCTGSEANDVAARIAKVWSGGTGIIVSAEAYHGNTELTSALSPALGSGQVLPPTTGLVTPPDIYRHPHTADPQWFAQELQRVIDDMSSRGIKFAGMMADSIFSSDGLVPEPIGFLRAAVDVVHQNGGLFIADEVQPGFARTGDTFWGFARHDVVPDIITTGKPMGNGIPISALLAKEEIINTFSAQVPYFNTFGGNPVSIAAATAVLRVIQEEGLQEHAKQVGKLLRDELTNLKNKHEAIGDVRGAGLYIAVELVKDPQSKAQDKQLALNTIEAMRERGVLTSVTGTHGNILKIRPPLPFQEADIEWLVGALDESLTLLTKDKS